MTLPEVQALVQAVRADEQAALAAKAAKESRSEPPEPVSPYRPLAHWPDWSPPVAPSPAARKAAPDSDAWPIRITAEETRPGFNPYAERKPDTAVDWDAAVSRIGK
jgi:hypothetical protein